MIEFVVIRFLIDSFDDYLFEKSLERVIPDLPLLHADPHRFFETREIHIGPRRRYCGAAYAGLIWGFTGVGICYLFLLVLPRLLGLPRIKEELYWATLVTVGVSCFFFVIRRFCGGLCVLTGQGVEFRYRGRVVRCPWEVFNTQGYPAFGSGTLKLYHYPAFDPLDNWLLLPISSHATDFITEISPKNESPLFIGLNVRTPQWQPRSPTEVPPLILESSEGTVAALKHVYVVNPLKLGDLLLQMGRKLSLPQPTRMNREAVT